MFIFGDYQGTRSNVGGSKLLTVPTQAARSGDLSAYGVNIYDPATGEPRSGTQFANNMIPAGPAVAAGAGAPEADSAAERGRARENGTRDNFVASGSELFNNDTFDVRVDGRVLDRLNVFGRYSFARLPARRSDGVRAGRRPGAGHAGRRRRRCGTRAWRPASTARSAPT